MLRYLPVDELGEESGKGRESSDEAEVPSRLAASFLIVNGWRMPSSRLARGCWKRKWSISCGPGTPTCRQRGRTMRRRCVFRSVGALGPSEEAT